MGWRRWMWRRSWASTSEPFASGASASRVASQARSWRTPRGRGDRPLSLSDAQAARVVAEACRPPGDVGIPITHWSAHLLADYLRREGWDLSESTVRRI